MADESSRNRVEIPRAEKEQVAFDVESAALEEPGIVEERLGVARAAFGPRADARRAGRVSLEAAVGVIAVLLQNRARGVAARAEAEASRHQGVNVEVLVLREQILARVGACVRAHPQRLVDVVAEHVLPLRSEDVV